MMEENKRKAVNNWGQTLNFAQQKLGSVPNYSGSVPHHFSPILGFESTDYAYLGERIVWVGDDVAVRHPRNYWKPWQAPPKTYSAALLQAGARLCAQHMASANQAQGLLAWLLGRELPFPLQHAAQRFDDVRTALQSRNLPAFEQAALRVLGLGNGLTPSGDDFLGGIFFGLHFLGGTAHKPYADWLSEASGLQANVHKASRTSTNPISAALLSDSMAGSSYGQLHDMLDALASNDSRFIQASCQALLDLGSSSGADLLAGLLLALTTSQHF